MIKDKDWEKIIYKFLDIVKAYINIWELNFTKDTTQKCKILQSLGFNTMKEEPERQNTIYEPHCTPFMVDLGSDQLLTNNPDF